jgi:hypothetical protein
MASAHTHIDPYSLTVDIDHRPLTALESHCLLARICDCHAVVQCALSGILWAQQHQQSGGLAAICVALRAAEVEIARAAGQAAQIHDTEWPTIPSGFRAWTEKTR